MISKIKITSKGQITIPKALREKMNLKEGMYMSAYIQDGNLILKPLPQDSNKIKLLNYAHKESLGSIGISKVREMAKDFNLDISEQVREIREKEAVIDE